MNNIETAVQSILTGEYDETLETLLDAIHERKKSVRKVKAQQNKLLLSVGDHVTLSGLSPKYINGAVVKVAEIRRTRCLVEPIDGVTPNRVANRFGMGVTVPLNCVTKAD